MFNLIAACVFLHDRSILKTNKEPMKTWVSNFKKQCGDIKIEEIMYYSSYKSALELSS